MLRGSATEISSHGPKATVSNRIITSEGVEDSGCCWACHLVCHKYQQVGHLIFSPVTEYLTMGKPLSLTFLRKLRTLYSLMLYICFHIDPASFFCSCMAGTQS